MQVVRILNLLFVLKFLIKNLKRFNSRLSQIKVGIIAVSLLVAIKKDNVFVCSVVCVQEICSVEWHTRNSQRVDVRCKRGYA